MCSKQLAGLLLGSFPEKLQVISKGIGWQLPMDGITMLFDQQESDQSFYVTLIACFYSVELRQ